MANESNDYDRRERLHAIFNQAISLSSPEERQRYVAEVCASDPDLRRRVESLLRAHEQADRFLDHSVTGEPLDPIAEEPGTIIGREAEALFRRGLAIRRPLGLAHFEYRQSVSNTGDSLWEQGKHAAAEAFYREQIEAGMELWGEEPHVHLFEWLGRLASNLWPQGKYAEAELVLEQTLAMQSQLAGTEYTPRVYAMALTSSGLALSGYHGVKEREDQIPVYGRPQLREALRALVQLYEETDRPDEAARWRRQLAELESAVQ